MLVIDVGTQRVHLVATSFDYVSGKPDTDRIGYIFERSGADKVYILFNENIPEDDKEHKSLEEDAITGVRATIEEMTMAEERGGIHESPINFYDFESALISIYKIIIEEQQYGNEIHLNVSGGTKPVAIAMAFASALTDLNNPPYYVARDYVRRDDKAVSNGVLDTPFPISTLHPFNITDLIPRGEMQVNLLKWLIDRETKIGVTELLISEGMVPESPNQELEDDNETRKSRIQRYHRHVSKLVEDGLLEKKEGKVALTETGQLVAKLVKARETTNDTSNQKSR